jgi:tyramine---L-glutamate ligase
VKVIVYEHISGGGYAEKPIPPSILCEGFGMLREVVSDFKAAGHEVTVLLDARLSKLKPPIDAGCITPIVYSKEPEKFLSNIAQINDAIYIIAPETGQTLQSLIELAEKTGKTSLNCKSSAIAKVADKAVLYEKLAKNGVPTPKTITLSNGYDDLEGVKQAIKQKLNYPIILKPADGVGCSGLSLIKNQTQLERAIAKIKTESKSKRFIAQEFIKGEAASVSLLSTGKKAVALSLNKQNINIAEPEGTSSYEGGVVPFSHPLEGEAFALAEKVVESVSGLRGYVGVDLVLAETEAFLVDVNPRLTTSYVGLREVAGFNVAESLVNAVMHGKLPDAPKNNRVACFSKMETPKPSINAYQKASKLAEVVSPPFPLNGSTKACALLIGRGDSLEEATLRLEEAKKHSLNIIT